MKFSRGVKPKLRQADDFCEMQKIVSFFYVKKGVLEEGGFIVFVRLALIFLGALDNSILLISPDLRQIALIVILAKAGLALVISDLKKVGRPAIMLCFIPASLEMIGFMIFGPALLHVSLLEAGIIGAVMGAVSPAVIIPQMSKMIDEGWGTKQGIPQMIIAGSSADDIYVIVIFTALVSLAVGDGASALDFVQIPVSIITGIMLGVAMGLALVKLFKNFHMRDTAKVVIILSVSFLLVALEELPGKAVSVSGLLAVMSMGMTIYNRYDILAKRISGKFLKLWVAAEIILFVLMGATADIEYAAKAGVMLFIGLTFRLFGTWLCRAWHPFESEGAAFLPVCADTEGNRTGGHWRGAAGEGTCLWKYRTDRCCCLNSDISAGRSIID